MAQLAKQHRDELGPARETTRVTFGSVLPHGGLELQAGEELQHLGENATYSIHGGDLLSVVIVLGWNNLTTYQNRRLTPQTLIWTSLISQ
jgi:hypothetical protein